MYNDPKNWYNKKGSDEFWEEMWDKYVKEIVDAEGAESIQIQNIGEGDGTSLHNLMRDKVPKRNKGMYSEGGVKGIIKHAEPYAEDIYVDYFKRKKLPYIRTRRTLEAIKSRTEMQKLKGVIEEKLDVMRTEAERTYRTYRDEKIFKVETIGELESLASEIRGKEEELGTKFHNSLQRAIETQKKEITKLK